MPLYNNGVFLRKRTFDFGPVSSGPNLGSLSFFRTGSASYINALGAYTVASDCTPRYTANGLLLEGAGTNILTAPNDFLNAAWQKQFGGTGTLPTISAENTTLPDGTTGTAHRCVFNSGANTASGNYSNITQVISGLTNPHTASNSIWLKSATGTAYKVGYGNPDSDTSPTWKYVNVGSEWVRVSASIGSLALTKCMHQIGAFPYKSSSDTYIDIYLWHAQSELNPFPSSYTDGTRNADICALQFPYNELKDSNDLTTANWTKSAGCSVSNAGGLNTVTLAATTDNVYQETGAEVTPIASTTRTAAVKLRAGTLSGSVLLRLLNQSGTSLGSTTINTASLSATEGRTFFVPATSGASDTAVRVQLIGNSGTGTIIVESVRMVQGTFPGVEVVTGANPVLKPANAGVDPAWVQNGFVEFDVVLPTISAGKDYNIIGSGYTSSVLSLWRYSANSTSLLYSVYDRKHNGSSGTSSTPGRGALFPTIDIWGGTKHRIRLEWLNYTLSGTRYMWMRIYIDGVNRGEADVSALYGATAWIAPERLWLSDGNTFATINPDTIVIGYPTLPSGAVV